MIQDQLDRQRSNLPPKWLGGADDSDSEIKKPIKGGSKRQQYIDEIKELKKQLKK